MFELVMDMLTRDREKRYWRSSVEHVSIPRLLRLKMTYDVAYELSMKVCAICSDAKEASSKETDDGRRNVKAFAAIFSKWRVTPEAEKAPDDTDTSVAAMDKFEEEKEQFEKEREPRSCWKRIG
ncbi:hypothetical protein BLNAU_7902 [Blattamonas nauphoetae]|uniref:Uncharacterized protein n=1 Tax=Blattamonas nauphoetae TaxID=2049346 RepID=A0ABQ9Y010_9EUKA|nr:hypothetical protein BLNAU_7902 [Blattamonas nauphoetae]